jgi:TldD protein
MKESNLKPGMVELRPILGDVVHTLESKAPYGAVTLSSRENAKYLVDNNQEQVEVEDPTAGAILTVFDGNTLEEKAFGGFDQETLLTGARELVKNTKFFKNGKIDPGEKRDQDYQTKMEQDPAQVPTSDKLDYLRDLNQRINKIDSRIINARVNYLEFREKSVFRNRSADISQDIQRVRMFIMVVVKGEKGVVFDWVSKCGSAGLEVLTFSDEELETLVKNTIKLTEAERIEPGEYTVISSPGVSGVICHESFGHGVETDMFLKERAKAINYLDRRVGSELVNIYDDPSYPGGFGSYFFDDEGYPAASTQIVEDGIFKRGLTDLYSATVLKIPRSPNGRRQDLTRKVYPRMTNTYVGAGDTPLDELIGRVDDGIYLSKFSSGMEDPKGWGIQVTCHYGYEIKGGKLTDRMFSPIGLTGYVPDVLSSIGGVSNDFQLHGGTCGKGSKESVPVTSGGPHLLMEARLG